LPLDDCLYALQSSIPHLTRSALHRCLQRHGISRLPDIEGDRPKRQKFKRYPIGFFHIDIAEVQTGEGKLYLFVGIDRTAKFAVAQLVETADRRTAWEFLLHMLEAVPYEVHTILTDNGIQFAEQPRNRNTIYSRPMRFDMICEANGIGHRRVCIEAVLSPCSVCQSVPLSGRPASLPVIPDQTESDQLESRVCLGVCGQL
jgi:hypothetical protein